MNGLNVYCGVGRITAKDYKEIKGKWVCNLRFAVNTWIPGKDGAEGHEETLWLGAEAWTNPGDKYDRAAEWNKKWNKGMLVSITGNPKVTPWTSKEGKAGYDLDLNNIRIQEIKTGGSDNGAAAPADDEEMPF